MAVFHMLCGTAWSWRAHRTESMSVMGHTRSTAVCSTEWDQKQRNIIVHISLFRSDVLSDRHVLWSEDDFGWQMYTLQSTRQSMRDPHLQMTSWTWSLADRWLVSVIPKMFTWDTRWMSGNGGGIRDLRDGDAVLRLQFSNMISVDLARLIFRLFLWARCATLSSSASLKWAFLAGITMYISSAYCALSFLWSQWTDQIWDTDDIGDWANCRSLDYACRDV